MTVYERVLSIVNTASTQYIGDTIQKVATTISEPTYILLTVYVLFMGWQAISGNIKEPVLDLTKRLLKICIIAGLALKLAQYNVYITDVFFKGPENFAASIMGTGSQTAILDELLMGVWDVGTNFWERGSLSAKGLGLCIAALMMYAVGIALSAYACFLIVLSKMATAVLIGIGPLFIVSLLFKTTKKFFESWISMLANYGLIYILVIAINSFILKIFNGFIGKVLAAAEQPESELADVAPLIVVALIGIFILGQIVPLASALSNGAANLATFGVGNKIASGGMRVGQSGAYMGYKGAKTAGAATYRGARATGGKVARAVVKRYSKKPA